MKRFVSLTRCHAGAASRVPYLHLTGAQKPEYQVGKRAAEFGTTNTLGIMPSGVTRNPLRELYT